MLKSHAQAEKLTDKFEQMKKLAMRKVATTVKLLVEPALEAQLADLYMDSFMKEYKDEKMLG